MWSFCRGPATELILGSTRKGVAVSIRDDAKEAYKAIGEMMDSPKSALILLKDRVKPISLPRA